MANDFSNLTKEAIISQMIVNELETKLIPISFGMDASNEVASHGDSITLHLYKNVTANAIQNISGGVINYANTKSDVQLTPVTVTLDQYSSEGFDIPELVIAKSPVKDVVSKFASKKVNAMAKEILTAVMAKIDASYTTTVSAGADYNWAEHMNKTLAAVYTADLDPAEVTVVLDNTRFVQLVASIPTLAGIDRTEVLSSGVIEQVGGTKIVRSSVMPSGCKGFASSRNALATAFRSLPALAAGMSYGQSETASTENGLTIRVRRYQNPDTGLLSVRFDNIWGSAKFDVKQLIRIV
jgi:hypothetical protein